MNKILGTRCPECGTGDAPSVFSVPFGDDRHMGVASCPRCERTESVVCIRIDEALTAAKVIFYDSQPETEEQSVKSEELPRCRCGGIVDLHEMENGQMCAECLGCYARTPEFPTAAEARACWRRMMEGGK